MIIISKEEYDNMYRLRWKPNSSGLYYDSDINECVEILRTYLNSKQESPCGGCVSSKQDLIKRYKNWFDKTSDEFKVEE